MFDLLTLLADTIRDALPVLLPPLLLWTAVACLAEGALRLTRKRIHPVWSTAVRTVLVAALPLQLLLAPFATQWFAQSPAVIQDAIYTLQLSAISAPVAEQEATIDPVSLLISALALVWIGGILIGLARTMNEAVSLRRMTESLPKVSCEVHEMVSEIAQAAGIKKKIVVSLSDEHTPPYTFGHRHPHIVVPEHLTHDPAALRLALEHEISHVRHRDFLRHLAERLLVVVAWPHPLMYILHRALALDRERLADADVLTRHPRERRTYSDLLLSFASRPIPQLALGATPGFSQLTNRLETMKRPILSLARLNRTRSTARVLSTVLFGVFVGFGALATHAQDDDPAPTPIPEDAEMTQLQPPVGPDEAGVYNLVEENPVLIGGIEGLLERVEYPREFRGTGAEARIYLQFVVNEDGTPTDVQAVGGDYWTVPGEWGEREVEGGLGSEHFRQAAIRAVEGSRFEPGMQDGKPVKVRFSLPVNFRLNSPDPPSSPPPPGEAPEEPPAPPPPPPPAPDTIDVFDVVEQQPVLIGGIEGLQERVVYPEDARQEGIEGRVFLQFVVNEGGTVGDVNIARSPDPRLSEAATKALEASRFEPGVQDGEPVKVQFSLPVNFSLSEPSVEEGE